MEKGSEQRLMGQLLFVALVWRQHPGDLGKRVPTHPRGADLEALPSETSQGLGQRDKFHPGKAIPSLFPHFSEGMEGPVGG